MNQALYSGQNGRLSYHEPGGVPTPRGDYKQGSWAYTPAINGILPHPKCVRMGQREGDIKPTKYPTKGTE